jgi:hypothetical protein
VCISDLFAPATAGKVKGKCAWDLGADEIADEVWRQISSALAGSIPTGQGEFPMPRPGLPTPLAYHLDENLHGRPGPRRKNLSPLLINTPGTWKARPGSTDGYELVFDRVVFAGTYMQTHTRLTTMEAANESARHAVNAILGAKADGPQRGNLCSIWSPEDNELDDLAFLKKLDERLLHRGLPHFVDILDPGASYASVSTVAEIVDLVDRLCRNGM